MCLIHNAYPYKVRTFQYQDVELLKFPSATLFPASISHNYLCRCCDVCLHHYIFIDHQLFSLHGEQVPVEEHNGDAHEEEDQPDEEEEEEGEGGEEEEEQSADDEEVVEETDAILEDTVNVA